MTWIDLAADERWSVRASHADRRPPAGEATHSSACGWKDGFAVLLDSLGIDLVFPVMHGAIGEDGQLQALCASISVAYVGCGPEAALRCYDKVAFKRAISAAGLPTARGLCVERHHHEARPDATVRTVARMIGYPCIVKPSRSGSSLGLARVESPEALTHAVQDAFRFDATVLVEELVPGSDVEIGVVGQTSPTVGRPVGIQYDSPLYDFAAKYEQGDTLEIPAALPDHVTAELMRAAEVAYARVGCRGLARVDFLVDRSGGGYVVNELNTIPYTTAQSSFSESLRLVTRESYEQLVARMAHRAWRDHRAAQR